MIAFPFMHACCRLRVASGRNAPQPLKCHCHKPVNVLQAVARACLARGGPGVEAGALQVGKITFGKLREIEGASGSTAASGAKATAAEGPAEELVDEKARITEAPGKAAEVQHSLSR